MQRAWLQLLFLGKSCFFHNIKLKYNIKIHLFKGSNSSKSNFNILMLLYLRMRYIKSANSAGVSSGYHISTRERLVFSCCFPREAAL